MVDDRLVTVQVQAMHMHALLWPRMMLVCACASLINKTSEMTGTGLVCV